MKELDIDRIGEKIGERRRKKNLTLKDLSEYTGLSIGFLSNLETGKTSPTLESLRMIVKALEINLIELLSAEKNKKILIKKDDVEIIEYKDLNMKSAIIDFGYGEYTNEIITIEPGEVIENQFSKHLSSESCTVITGELVVEIEDKTYVLKKYDSIKILEKQRHKIYNLSKNKSISYWTKLKK